MNISNGNYLQKIIHVPRQKILNFEGMPKAREYTTLVFYNRETKIARFEVATVHPKLDRFSRKQGREEVMKKLAEDNSAMLVDLKNITNDLVDIQMEDRILSNLLEHFTYFVVPMKLMGKK
jgi:hypothetical protein